MNKEAFGWISFLKREMKNLRPSIKIPSVAEFWDPLQGARVSKIMSFCACVHSSFPASKRK